MTTIKEYCDKLLNDNSRSLALKVRELTGLYYTTSDKREQSAIILTIEMMATKQAINEQTPTFKNGAVGFKGILE